MSLVNLFVAARSALAQRRQQRLAYHELMSLDDRSLADIGIHRSQIGALVEGADAPATRESRTDPVVASAFGCGGQHVAAGRSWMPPV